MAKQRPGAPVLVHNRYVCALGWTSEASSLSASQAPNDVVVGRPISSNQLVYTLPFRRYDNLLVRQNGSSLTDNPDIGSSAIQNVFLSKMSDNTHLLC